MLRLPPKKIGNIVIMVFIFGVALIMINIKDDLKPTRDELINLYEATLDNCTLTKLDKRKYPQRGDYSVFYTDCLTGAFPILLERDTNWGHYDLFKESVQLTKESKSTDLKITDKGTIHNVRLRNPKDEDDRPFGTKVALIFMAASIVLILLLPNSLFEKKE